MEHFFLSDYPVPFGINRPEPLLPPLTIKGGSCQQMDGLLLEKQCSHHAVETRFIQVTAEFVTIGGE
jgi:hypothetical protein